MKKIIRYSLMLSLALALSLFINIKASDNHLNAEASTSIKFRAGSVLPATTQLKIFSTTAFTKPVNTFNGSIKTNNGDFILLEIDFIKGGISHYKLNGEEINPYDLGSGFIIDTSNWTIEKRTVSSITYQLSNGTIVNMYYIDIAPPSYTITFNSNGGTTISHIEEATELPTPLPTTTKSGYTFLGWYYDSNFTTQAYAEDELEDDVTLYAKWQLTTYTITFNSNGGSSVSPISGVTALPDPLPTPTKDDYNFLGWRYDNDDVWSFASPGDPLTSDVTLYAGWLLKSYTITFESNGGSLIPSQSGFWYFPEWTSMYYPTKTGYNFAGWYMDSLLTEPALTGERVPSNITLYAKWEEKVYYRIFYNTNGGNILQSIPLEDEGIIFDNLPIPERNNDIFIGWYFDESLSDPVEPNDTISSDITLYASWIDYITLIEHFNTEYINGYETGFLEAFDVLYDDGYDRGFPIGYGIGYGEGYQDGLMTDHPIEYQEFYGNGFREARDKYGKQLNEYEWESAQIAYENGVESTNKFSNFLIYGFVSVTVIGGIILYFSLKRRND